MARCALLATSDFNSTEFLRRYKAQEFDYIIAVDAGYEHLHALGIKPNLAIGDFDSLGYVPKDCETLIFEPHKDASDLELALMYAQEHNFSKLYLFGVLGGRIDHSIANTQILASYAEHGMDIYIFDLHAELHYLVGPAELCLPAREMGYLSIFSLSPECRGLTLKGFEYSLEHAVLSNRTSRGLSNEFIGENAFISLEEGTLLIVQAYEVSNF